MKTKIVFFAFLIGGFLLHSCKTDKTFVPTEDSVSMPTEITELDAYMQGQEFRDFIRWNNLNNTIVGEVTTKAYPSKKINAYLFSLTEKDAFVGEVCVVIKTDGTGAHAFFSDWRKVENYSGTVNISDVNGEYISTIETQKVGKKIRYSITDIRSHSTTGNLRSSESYVDCVARVYGEAKRACESDPKCDLLCDLANVANNSCTLAMITAAAVTCVKME